jgi:hypothetical protein
MFPYEELLLENGLADKPVLLSYRTQQMLLMAVQKMEVRYNWLEMDDTTWDELDNYIAQAETEILTEIEDYPMVTTVVYASRASNQAITANTDTAVIWAAGNYDTSNPTRLYVPQDGKIVVQAAVQLTASVAAAASAWLQFSDGSRHSWDDADAARATHLFNPVWIYGQATDANYVELFVRLSQAGNVNVATTPPYMSILRLP